MRTVFKRFYLLTGMAAALSCCGCMKSETLPVSSDKLVKVLADIHIAESALAAYQPPKKDSMADVFYRQVLEMHGMEREELDSCVAILRRNPLMMKEVYDKVYAHLEKVKEEGD